MFLVAFPLFGRLLFLCNVWKLFACQAHIFHIFPCYCYAFHGCCCYFCLPLLSLLRIVRLGSLHLCLIWLVGAAWPAGAVDDTPSWAAFPRPFSSVVAVAVGCIVLWVCCMQQRSLYAQRLTFATSQGVLHNFFLLVVVWDIALGIWSGLCRSHSCKCGKVAIKCNSRCLLKLPCKQQSDKAHVGRGVASMQHSHTLVARFAHIPHSTVARVVCCCTLLFAFMAKNKKKRKKRSKNKQKFSHFVLCFAFRCCFRFAAAAVAVCSFSFVLGSKTVWGYR